MIHIVHSILCERSFIRYFLQTDRVSFIFGYSLDIKFIKQFTIDDICNFKRSDIMTVSPACSCVGRCRAPCTPVLSDKPGVLVICNICCVFYFNFDITARHREMSDKRIYAAQLCFKCFSIFICYRYFVYYIFLSKVLKFQIYLRTSLGLECDRGICCSFA